MSRSLTIGLIGAGVFANYHANKLSAHEHVDFIGVFDVDPRRAYTLAEKHDTKVYSLQNLLDNCDAIIVASTASSHSESVLLALKSGCHCLVEKPMSTTAKAADAIVEAAAASRLIVQVGHQERLVLKAIGLDKVQERPLEIKAVRTTPYSVRGTDTSVTLDLMSHDIDLCNMLFGKTPDKIMGRSWAINSVTPDIAEARLYYCDATVDLMASRVADDVKRTMEICYQSGVVLIDFVEKTFTNSTSFQLNKDFATDAHVQDSLGVSVDIFIRAVLDGSAVLVNASEGALVTRIATQIDSHS